MTDWEVVEMPTHVAAVQFPDRRMLRASIQQVVAEVKPKGRLFPLAIDANHLWYGVHVHRLNVDGVPLRLMSGYDLNRGEYIHRLDVGYRED